MLFNVYICLSWVGKLLEAGDRHLPANFLSAHARMPPDTFQLQGLKHANAYQVLSISCWLLSYRGRCRPLKYAGSLWLREPFGKFGGAWLIPGTRSGERVQFKLITQLPFRTSTLQPTDPFSLDKGTLHATFSLNGVCLLGHRSEIRANCDSRTNA